MNGGRKLPRSELSKEEVNESEEKLEPRGTRKGLNW